MAEKLKKFIETLKKTHNIEIKVRRSIYRRSSYTIRVFPNLDVVIYVPFYFTQKGVISAISTNLSWIKDRLKYYRSIRYEYSIYKKIPFLGEDIKICFYKRKTFKLEENTLFIPEKYKNDEEKLKKAIIRWYKREFKKILKERLDYYSKKMGLKYNKFYLIESFYKWGSCNCITRNLRFHWRLVMMPIFIIDSVVVHELTHLIEKSHSKKFWAIVYRYFPEYKKSDKYLKKITHKLYFI